MSTFHYTDFDLTAASGPGDQRQEVSVGCQVTSGERSESDRGQSGQNKQE